MKKSKMSIEELNGSELGTKDYWDKSYSREIKNYTDHGDVGEIWFDEDSQNRIISWILQHDEIKDDAKIIDLGCGNGMFCIEMAREGYTKVTGIDYSANAIQLAKNIAKDQDLQIQYEVIDLLNADECDKLNIFDIVHDKGTYDAISLCPDNAKQKRELYLNSVYKLIGEQGVFIITSCNWTEDELILSFADKFVKRNTIPTPTFKFGGKVGSVVTSVVFKRK